MVSSPRRVRLALIALASISFLLVFRSSISLPESFKDIDSLHNWVSSSSKLPVDEIYGLLHVVTSAQDPPMTLNEDIDWTQAAKNMKMYTGGRSVDWTAEKKRIDKLYPVIMFSKTYCPFSRRAKALLEDYDLSPPPKVIELDTRTDNAVIKTILTRLTGLGTVPNTLVHGKSLGGSDSLQALHEEGVLADRLKHGPAQ